MLKTSTISFPGFGIGEFSVNSEAFSIFGVSIAWYALIITLGMIIATVYIIYRGKQIGLSFDDSLDFILWAIPVGVLGARLYYVLMKLEDYHSFKEVFDLRSGGLAIYGGIIAGAIAVIVVSYVKKINFFAFADCCTPGIILAQAIGRWGNFANGEAYGTQTEIFCRMGLQNSNTFYDFGTNSLVYVHPTFLYESLWNLLGFVLVNLFYKHKKYDGQIFLMVFGWYGLGRMLIEGLRTDSLTIFGGAVRVSQLLAGIIFAVCLVALIYLQIKKPEKPLYFKESKKENEKTEA